MTTPLRIALVNDYEIVLAGIREMLAPYSPRLQVVEIDANADVKQHVDIALYDTYGQDQSALASVRQPLGSATVDKVVLYTWSHTQALSEAAAAAGIDGILSKTMSADQIASSLMLIAEGQRIFMPKDEQPNDVCDTGRGSTDWPGRAEGLTMREAEMVTLIAQGLSNAEIASRTYLSPNSVKSYIRSAYRKIGVQRRSQAVAWGIDHDMVPDRSRQVVEPQLLRQLA